MESRCGILCGKCEWQKNGKCKGCVNIDNPFWGACPVKSCCEGRGLYRRFITIREQAEGWSIAESAVNFRARGWWNLPTTRIRGTAESGLTSVKYGRL